MAVAEIVAVSGDQALGIAHVGQVQGSEPGVQGLVGVGTW